MKTLDRHIVRQFLMNYAILAVVLVVLFSIVNVIVDLDEFLEAGRNNAARFGGSTTLATLWAMVDFNGPLVAVLYVYFAGLLAVGAMGFTFAGMHRARELIAVLASGVSAHRVAAPVLVAGALLSALALPIQEFAIPPLAHKIARSKAQVGRDAVKPLEITFAVDSQHRLLSAAKFDIEQQTLTGVSILERTADGRAQGRITAESARWEDDGDPDALVEAGGSGNHTSEGASPATGRWVLTHGLRQKREPGADMAIGRQGEPVDFIQTDLSPQVLMVHRQDKFLRLLSLRDLEQLAQVRVLIDREQIIQIMHSRFSLLILNVLVLVIGLPFFLLREPGNMLLQGTKAAAMCVGAWGGGLVLLQVGTDMVNPWAAAWLPVALYLPLSAVMLVRVKT